MLTNEAKTGNLRQIAIVILIFVTVIGAAFRFYQITENRFIYYDEGMWLNNQRGFVTLIEANPPKDFSELGKILGISFQMSLRTGKALWAFLAMMRGFFTGVEGGYFVRLISAVCGVLSLGMTYLFTKKYFKSQLTAILAMALLAFLPSHFYYSQTGLQEGFSTLCFLLGMYFYFFQRKLNFRIIFSAFFFACVFFSNYRMIIIPLLVGLGELYYSFSHQEKLQWRKFSYSMLMFLGIVFIVGSLNGGANTQVTFGWMFHQANLADGKFNMINLLSYPYYIFRLESVIFGLLFFGNIYFIVKKDWPKLLPFFLVIVLMGMFSFAEEKGVRYLCAGMPFMVMAVSVLIVTVYNTHKKNVVRTGIVVLVMAMFIIQGVKIGQIMNFDTDYKRSMNELTGQNADVKVLSTQNNIQTLFSAKSTNVREAPQDIQHLLGYYAQGFRYLVIDPQAYISFTDNEKRFTSKLVGYLGFIRNNIPHERIYPHFNQALLERFALEHNVNLRKTIRFIKDNKTEDYGALRVYNLTQCIAVIRQALSMSAQ